MASAVLEFDDVTVPDGWQLYLFDGNDRENFPEFQEGKDNWVMMRSSAKRFCPVEELWDELFIRFPMEIVAYTQAENSTVERGKPGNLYLVK